MSVDISVIVPVYNVEPYLQECLDSILSQSGCSFEVICIDDGSTDSSLQILKAAAQKDSRIQIIEQVNQGLSAARNRGLDVATGHYILFVDSDDALMKNTFASLVSLANQKQLDHIVFGADVFADPCESSINSKHFTEEVDYYTVKDETLFNRIFSGGHLFKSLMLANSFYSSPPLHLMKHEVIGKLRFFVGILHEDDHFTPQALLAATRATIVPRKYYRRRIRGGSIMTASGINMRHVVGYLVAALKLHIVFDQIKDQELGDAPCQFVEILLAAAGRYLAQSSNAISKQLLIQDLGGLLSPEEIRMVQWIILPLLNQVNVANARVQKCRDKRLSSRLKRLFKRKGHTHVK